VSAASASTESRRGRRGGALAWGLCALGLAMLVTTLVMEATANREARIEVQYGTYVGAFFWLVSWQSFVIVGALIASRRPGNPIGWISISAGLATTLTGLTDSYARYALIAQPGSLPGGELAAWFSEWSWVVWIGLVGVFFVLLFPNGRLPSPRWRWLPRLTVAVIVTGVAGIALRPGPLEEAPYVRSNPLGIEGAEALVSVLEVGILLLPVCILFAGVSMVMRFRRSGGIERLQLKWLAYSVSVVAGLFFAVAFLWNLIPMMVEMNENEDEVVKVVQSVSLVLWAGLPISAGFAILRHRLYDIDRIINRTLVYGALTAILVAGYVGSVLLIQNLLPVSDDSPVAVAVSTLAMAALFGPLRVRIQGIVDRRFYRSRYDSAKTLERFGARLRQETDLDAITTALLGVIRETIRPLHASLWLRPNSVDSTTRQSP
jgi:MFS family permease